jgi:hypothetical protein
MTTRSSVFRISARMPGAVLASALCIAAPMVAVTSAPTQAQQVSVSAEFRTALEPHGRWERHSRWGEVWVPEKVRRDWRPYTVGRWVYSDEWGWYWDSDREEADWGWVTFHYGRWVADRNGWAWVPGDQWGPGFVQWRRGSERVGWAPLPPDDIVVEYQDDPDVWVFCRTRDFVVAPRLVTVILPPPQYNVYIRETVVVNRTVVLHDRGGFAVNPGIAPVIIASVAGRPVRSYDVRPRILAGTAQIPGGIVVGASELRDRQFQREATIRETRNVIQPTRGRVPEPQPLAAGEQGRLGDTPPRAARRGDEPRQPQDRREGRDRQEPGQAKGADQDRQQPAEREQQPRGKQEGRRPDEQQRGKQEGRRPDEQRGKQEGRPPDEQRGKQEGRRPDEQRGKQEGRRPDEQPVQQREQQERGKQEGRRPDEQRGKQEGRRPDEQPMQQREQQQRGKQEGQQRQQPAQQRQQQERGKQPAQEEQGRRGGGEGGSPGRRE